MFQRACQGCFVGVSRVFHGCFKGASWVLEGYFMNFKLNFDAAKKMPRSKQIYQILMNGDSS